MKVVINACFGGFSLSPQATLELWKRGALPGIPVAEYYGRSSGLEHDLAKWRDYLANGENRPDAWVTVFSPDESLVLYAGRLEEKRADPILVQIVEEMGNAASGSCARLKIVEVPDDVDWEIHEYDGSESVAEKHREWS